MCLDNDRDFLFTHQFKLNCECFSSIVKLVIKGYLKFQMVMIKVLKMWKYAFEDDL